MGTFPNQAVWAGSGNNCRLSTDITRRTIKIVLNRNMEKPWEWTGAKIPNLEQWTLDHRRQLLAAGLTLIQSWVAAGAKPSKHHLGSFEAWANTIGGILDHIGMPGFLSNTDKMHEYSDPKKMELKGFVLHWWNQHGDNKTQTAGALAAMAHDNDLLSTSIGASPTDRSRAIKVAKVLADNRNRVISDLKIKVSTEHNQAVYSLEIVEGGNPPPRETNPTPTPKPWGNGPPPHSDRDRYS
jgi:putative DNA primase/helicase